MNCPNCHEPFPADAAFCPNCGTRQEPASPPPAQASGVRTFSGMSTIAPMREHRASVLEPGTMFAERYEVVRKLGEGGMGVVYVALDKHTGEELVLKLIHPDLVTGDDAIKRLMAEGLTARQIRHPNIVAVYDVAQWNGQPYFSMEFVRGGTLRSWMVNHISSGTDVKLETAAGIIRTMLKGIAEAHRMGVVHRDLKPENVLLSGDPDAGDFNLKILDFGIAKAVNAPRSGSGSGGPLGTPLYMAPEQMTSAESVGPAADIYSLSVMFYELLMEASPQARWEPISRNRPDVPKAIDDLIEKGLSARPRSRYASVAEYEAALDTAMKAMAPKPAPDPVRPEPVRPDPPPPPPPPPPPSPLPPPLPPPEPRNAWAWMGPLGSMSKKAKMWTGIGAAVVVFGIIGSNVEQDSDGDGFPDSEDACPSIAGVAPVGCPELPGMDDDDDDVGPPPTVPPTTTTIPRAAVPNLAGAWRDAYGNIFTVQQSGNVFTGTGFVPGSGTITFRGTLASQGATITMSAGGRTFFQGNGSFGPAQGGIDVAFDGHLFHVNH